ncbi:MAG: hypothetical protein EOO39_06545 [Cytophagaceae bacterium]|nr:MAG: hypothetical protein EOO39_06545 [Cytophagaceae bacterium]
MKHLLAKYKENLRTLVFMLLIGLGAKVVWWDLRPIIGWEHADIPNPESPGHMIGRGISTLGFACELFSFAFLIYLNSYLKRLE